MTYWVWKVYVFPRGQSLVVLYCETQKINVANNVENGDKKGKLLCVCLTILYLLRSSSSSMQPWPPNIGRDFDLEGEFCNVGLSWENRHCIWGGGGNEYSRGGQALLACGLLITLRVLLRWSQWAISAKRINLPDVSPTALQPSINRNTGVAQGPALPQWIQWPLAREANYFFHSRK